MTNYGPAKSYELYQSCSVYLTTIPNYGQFVVVTSMIVADVYQTIFTTKYLRDVCSVMTQENAGLISSA